MREYTITPDEAEARGVRKADRGEPSCDLPATDGKQGWCHRQLLHQGDCGEPSAGGWIMWDTVEALDLAEGEAAVALRVAQQLVDRLARHREGNSAAQDGTAREWLLTYYTSGRQD